MAGRRTSAPAAPEQLGYQRSLDGLRAVAVTGVVVFHAWRPVLPNGAIGVDVFFVLSGFLITTLLLEEWAGDGRIRLAAFYLRRAARLLPALAVVLAVCTLWAAASHSPAASGTGRGVLFATAYSTDFALALHPNLPLGPLGHMWSLSIEEQFYVLWPIVLVAVAARGGARRVLLVAIVGAALALMLRLLLSGRGAPFNRLYFGPDTRADALLIGCALAAARHAHVLRHVSSPVVHVLAYAGASYLVVAAVAPQLVPGVVPWGFSVTAVAAALCIWGLIGPASTARRALSSVPFVFLGRISYGVYLWHLPIQAILVNGFGIPFGPWSLAAVLGASVLTAHLSHRVLEDPCRRWCRRRLARRLTTAVAA